MSEKQELKLSFREKKLKAIREKVAGLKIKTAIFPYEPKPVPELDDHGNNIKNTYPLAIPCTMSMSDEMRKKHFPNELGLSADRNDVTGFRALLDVINAGKDLQGTGLIPAGQDDLFVMQRTQQILEWEKRNSQPQQ